MGIKGGLRSYWKAHRIIVCDAVLIAATFVVFVVTRTWAAGLFLAGVIFSLPWAVAVDIIGETEGGRKCRRCGRRNPRDGYLCERCGEPLYD